MDNEIKVSLNQLVNYLSEVNELNPGKMREVVGLPYFTEDIDKRNILILPRVKSGRYGILGILEGLFYELGDTRRITAVVDGSDKTNEKILRFILTKE